MKSLLTKPHHLYNNLDLGHTPAIYEVTDPGFRFALSVESPGCIEISKEGGQLYFLFVHSTITLFQNGKMNFKLSLSLDPEIQGFEG